jgi:hypothetical protein
MFGHRAKYFVVRPFCKVNGIPLNLFSVVALVALRRVAPRAAAQEPSTNWVRANLSAAERGGLSQRDNRYQLVNALGGGKHVQTVRKVKGLINLSGGSRCEDSTQLHCKFIVFLNATDCNLVNSVETLRNYELSIRYNCGIEFAKGELPVEHNRVAV